MPGVLSLFHSSIFPGCCVRVQPGWDGSWDPQEQTVQGDNTHIHLTYLDTCVRVWVCVIAEAEQQDLLLCQVCIAAPADVLIMQWCSESRHFWSLCFLLFFKGLFRVVLLFLQEHWRCYQGYHVSSPGGTVTFPKHWLDLLMIWVVDDEFCWQCFICLCVCVCVL